MIKKTVNPAERCRYGSCQSSPRNGSYHPVTKFRPYARVTLSPHERKIPTKWVLSKSDPAHSWAATYVVGFLRATISWTKKEIETAHQAAATATTRLSIPSRNQTSSTGAQNASGIPPS